MFCGDWDSHVVVCREILPIFKMVNKYCLQQVERGCVLYEFWVVLWVWEGEGGINLRQIFDSIFVYLGVVGEFVESILGKYLLGLLVREESGLRWGRYLFSGGKYQRQKWGKASY